MARQVTAPEASNPFQLLQVPAPAPSKSQPQVLTPAVNASTNVSVPTGQFASSNLNRQSTTPQVVITNTSDATILRPPPHSKGAQPAPAQSSSTQVAPPPRALAATSLSISTPTTKLPSMNDDDSSADSDSNSDTAPSSQKTRPLKRPSSGSALSASPVVGVRGAQGLSPRMTAAKAKAPTTFVDPFRIAEPPRPAFDINSVLHIEEQPAQFGRFRYIAEGRLTFIEGRRPGSYPTITVNPNYRQFIPDGTLIDVRLVTRHDDANGVPVPHWHTLNTREGGSIPQPLHNGRCTFRYLVVQRNKSDVKYNAADQRAVRLMFTIKYTMAEEQRTASVMSQPIFNADLKIDRLSHSSSPVEGGNTIFILCSKIQKKTIALRISDSRYGSFVPMSTEWEQDPENGSYVIVLRSHQLDSHHQYAVIAEMPPYHHPNVTTPVVVWLQLMDESDETASAPAAFEYIPSSSPHHQASKFMRASSMSTDWNARMQSENGSSQSMQ